MNFGKAQYQWNDTAALRHLTYDDVQEDLLQYHSNSGWAYRQMTQITTTRILRLNPDDLVFCQQALIAKPEKDLCYRDHIPFTVLGDSIQVLLLIIVDLLIMSDGMT